MIHEVVQAALHARLRAGGASSVRVSTTEGSAHAYVVRGQGQGTVALLHGFASSATAYSALIRRLRRSFGVILAPDLLGHGRSELRGMLTEARLRRGLGETLDALLPPRALLVGTSLGGAAAVRYALERPRRLAGLVLVSPAGAPLSDVELTTLRGKFDVRTSADARRFFADLLHEAPWYSALLGPLLVQMLGRAALRDFLARVDSSDLLRAEDVATLSVPTLVLWGRSDRLLPRSSLEFFRGALPALGRVEEPAGLGHSPHFEQPAWLADRIARFSRELGERLPPLD